MKGGEKMANNDGKLKKKKILAKRGLS